MWQVTWALNKLAVGMLGGCDTGWKRSANGTIFRDVGNTITVDIRVCLLGMYDAGVIPLRVQVKVVRTTYLSAQAITAIPLDSYPLSRTLNLHHGKLNAR